MDRKRMIPGVILIALGLLFLLMPYFEFGPGLLLAMLGFVFLVAYVLTRLYGLLIPGCILAGLGAGMMFERSVRMDVAAPIGLGMGFIAIYLIQLVVARGSHWWPLVPGGVLLLVGIAQGVPQAQTLVQNWWPLILIVIGVTILAGQFLRPQVKDANH